MHRLHAVLDGKIRIGGEFFQEVEHFIRHAIAACADGQADDLRVGEGSFVKFAQALHGGVSVGRWLKVSEKVIAIFVAISHAGDALVDLAQDAGAGESATGTEAAVVAEGAAPLGDGAVDVGASEAGIETYLLDAVLKTLGQGMIVGIITQARVTPGWT